MSIFEAYDQEFSSISQEISKHVSELKSYTTSSERSSSLIRIIDGLFSQSSDLMKQMKIEARSHDAATKKVLADKILQYEKSNSSLRSDYDRAKEQAQRSELIGNKSAEDRQRLLSTKDKLVYFLYFQF
jgi:hypothetical protein